MSTIPHVIWDMGGVMYRYFTELMLDVGAELGWPLDQIALGPTGRVADHDYDRMLVGNITEREYLPIVVDRLRLHGIDFDPPRDLVWLGQKRPRTWEAIGRVHEAGHRQAVLTNDASRWLGDNWWENWEHAEWFDAMIDVSTLSAPKPSPEPYRAVAEALGVASDDCLFVDDLPVNCAGARKLGMQSHLFEIADPVGSMERLEVRLGL